MIVQTSFRNCRWYIYGLILLVLFCILLLLFYGKSACFISLNSYHSYWLDVFFINYTFMGDGIFSIFFITVFFLFKRKKKQACVLLIAFLMSGLAAQIIKNIFNAPRPRLFFEAGQYLHFIDGVSLANNSSFPSGHTATAFAFATVLALFTNNKKRQLIILISASLVGYSRIYLAQHFLLDVLIGAIIGTGSGFLALYFLQNFKMFKPAIRKIHLPLFGKKIPAPANTFSA